MAGEHGSSIHPVVADIASESAVSRLRRVASFVLTRANLRVLQVNEAMEKSCKIGTVRMLVNNAGPGELQFRWAPARRSPKVELTSSTLLQSPSEAREALWT